jgi:hypothetical protein
MSRRCAIWLSLSLLVSAGAPIAGQEAAGGATFGCEAAQAGPEEADAQDAGGAGQAAGSSESELAKAAQNPVGELISLPLQNNTNLNVGPYDRNQNVLNIQPVWPFKLSERWNLITRTILPVISQPAPDLDRTDGIGDLNFTGFVSPREPGKVIWGFGPVLVFPTASDDLLGSGKFSLGPSLVVLTMPGNFVLGFLTNNVWSVAGDDDRGSVDSFLFQYFVNYNLPDGWYLSSAPILTNNRKAESGQRWTVPFGGGFGKVHRFGKLPVNISLQYFYNVEHPDAAGDSTVRFQVQFLFPK